MHRTLVDKQRGFTLIELLIVVAIVGILAAVAIPTFMTMMQRSKRSEAELNLDAISKGAKAYYVEHAGFPAQGEGAGELIPDEPCCEADQRTHKCPPNPELWKGTDAAPSVWTDLGFKVVEPSFFRYQYVSDGARFQADAVGDLDCDGTPITYVMVGDSSGGTPTYTLTKPTTAD